MIASYIDDMRNRRLAPATIHVRILVARSVERAWNPATVTAAQLAAWCASEWRARSPQTAASYTQHAKDFFGWLQRDGHRPDNPAATLPVPRVPHRLPRPIDEQDLACALACADPIMRAWLALGAYCGLRVCEIATLDRSDILPDAIRVRGKGGKERIIPAGPETLRLVYRAGLAKSGPVFRSRNGDPYDPEQIGRRIAHYLRGMGIEATAHQLRHRYATRVLALSHDIQLVRSLLGHESIATTQVYADFDRVGAAAAIAALDALLVA